MARSIPRWLDSRALAISAAILACGGCNSDSLTKDLGDAVKSVQDSVSTATGAVSGSIELSLDPPLHLETCFARFTPPSYDRPGVLELTSYEDPSGESFPSVYLRIETEGRLAEDLVGQSVPATLFIQRNSNGDLWHTDLNEPPQIMVVGVNSSLVTCEIAEAAMVRAGFEKTATVSGRIVGVRH